MPRGILKRVLELTLFNDLSQHKRLLIDQDQTMTLGTTCPTLIKQCHGFLNVPFRLIQKVKAGERILFPHHLLEMRNFHSNVSNLWAIQNLTTGDKPTVITVWGFRIAEKISTAA